MAIIKCKMCGGDLNIQEGMSVCECEYCGSKQTVPSADNEKKLTLFARANRLRAACEFDKAAGVYESIVADFPEEAEAYWGLVLCRYGIEYVDDPDTGKKVPTCHRSSFESIMDDSDLEQALENADAVARKVYRDEAKQIEEIRKGIIEVSGKEAPYDIFICYKETDENGDRTLDSVLAQDVYDALTEKGYRVFFSRISLEDKLGTEYEPYIFAALNSAKIMLAFGTDYEYYNAVWVKNEWSRFLKLMAKDKGKYLIPCYKGIDAYDMPKEFAKLQAQDMGKVGAVQDLLRGVEKLAGKSQTAPAAAVSNISADAEALITRGNLYLEDGDFKKAEEYFERALDIAPKASQAYLGLMLVQFRLTDVKQFENGIYNIENCRNFQRFLQFASDAEREMIQQTREDCQKRYQIWRLLKVLSAEKKRKEKEESTQSRLCDLYKDAIHAMNVANSENAFRDVASAFQAIHDYKDAYALSTQCLEKANALKQKQAKTIRTLLCDRDCHVAIAAGKYHTVGLRSDGTVVSIGDNKCGQCNVSDWTDIVAIAVGHDHTVGLRSDGTVVATGDNNCGQCNVSDWTDIVVIAAGYDYTVGLRSDGTAVAVGCNFDGQCAVSDWTDIVAIAAGKYHTVGLRSDGTAVAVGSNFKDQCAVSNWTDIVGIAVASVHTVGLRSDGTVVATGKNSDGQCDVSDWTDIVAIAAGDYHTVGLRSDGTVVATGKNDYDQCDVSDWTDIVGIAVGYYHTVGLRSDGTVDATGMNRDDQCNVTGWTSMVAICAGSRVTFALRSNGVVVPCGDAPDINQFFRSGGMRLFDRVEDLEENIRRNRQHRLVVEKAAEERRLAIEKAAAERKAKRIADLTAEKTALQTELANLKGIFSGKRRREIEARLAEIDTELQKLQ